MVISDVGAWQKNVCWTVFVRGFFYKPGGPRMKPGPEVCRPLLDYLSLSHYWTKVFQGPLKAVMSLVSFWFQQSISKVITFAEASWHPPKHLLIAQLITMWCSLEEQDAVPYAPPNETMNHHHPSLHPSKCWGAVSPLVLSENRGLVASATSRLLSCLPISEERELKLR